jgi:hypothetical protein
MELPLWKHYILQDGKIVEATMEEWAFFLEYGDRYIGQRSVRPGREHPTHAVWMPRSKVYIPHYILKSGVWVSTVFLGTCGRELFETMIFGGVYCGHQWRYNTMGEAQNGHQTAVDMATRMANWTDRRKRRKRIKKWFAEIIRFLTLVEKRGLSWITNERAQRFKSLLERLNQVPDKPFLDHVSHIRQVLNWAEQVSPYLPKTKPVSFVAEPAGGPN